MAITMWVVDQFCIGVNGWIVQSMNVTAMDNDIPLIDSSALYQRRQRGPSDATTMMTMDTPIK